LVRVCDRACVVNVKQMHSRGKQERPLSRSGLSKLEDGRNKRPRPPKMQERTRPEIILP
jgi:hypothetical protein